MSADVTAGSAELHQTLVVANRTTATPDLLAEIERRAAERPTAFTLLVPDVSKRKVADWTLEQALKSLRRAAGGPTGKQTAHVSGRVTGLDHVASVGQRNQRLLRMLVGERVQRLGRPRELVAGVQVVDELAHPPAVRPI